MIYSNYLLLTLAIPALLVLAGCQNGTKEAKAATSLPPPRVAVVVAADQDVPLLSEHAAQTYARDLVEVRGRVDGFIEKRLFQIGADVQAGQVLYVLDVRPYDAEVARGKAELAQGEANLEFARRQVSLVQAEADLAQAEANLLKAKQDVDRLQPLVKEDAAAQQDLDNALAALQANHANVAARKANVEQNRLSTKAQIETAAAQVESRKAQLRSAELNLEYATIKAPVSGKVGDSLIQVGGLVIKSSPQPLTTVIPLDPIWVRFKVSESAYLQFTRRSDREEARRRPIDLILADGTLHPYQGRLENTTNQVDPRTGTLELQGTFPNPQHNILAGQFGRVRLHINEKKDVIVVPQRAVLELQGMQSVYTVGPENKVQARSVVTGDRVGENWVIEQGLKPGDQVIVEGLQKVRPGSQVSPEPWKPKARK